jgi:flavin-dependent dehydrogenase
VGAEVPFAPLDAAELYFGNGVSPGFFAWAVPAGRGKARLGILASRNARPLFARFLKSDGIRSRLCLADWQEGMAVARGRSLGQGVVDPSFGERVLGVGEAAGQIKTTTLGGIYFGLLGAEIAAELLSEGLKNNRLGLGHLARYQEVWTRRLGGEIQVGLKLQKFAQELSDPEIDALFRALNNGLASTVRELVRFDWHQPALTVIMKRVLTRIVGRGA